MQKCNLITQLGQQLYSLMSFLVECSFIHKKEKRSLHCMSEHCVFSTNGDIPSQKALVYLYDYLASHLSSDL